ncbi:MAG: HlyD family efflux transporter periplasmic adaptor subunit [Thermodesulfobacteriota bacterium]|nr:MAG: HlyD family efflux transporter periplasmic adaptor subunit [Thermodesulfobacteriota bacterium]
MKTRKILAGVILVAVIIAAVFYFSVKGVREDADFLEATGVIEAMEVDLTPKISEKITRLCCRVGDVIKKGDVAVSLDATELSARVEEARATLNAAGEGVKEARVELEDAMLSVETARYEVEAARAEVARYTALTEESGRDFKRAEGLIKDGFITEKGFDAARAVLDANSAQLNSAVARMRADTARLRNTRVKVKMSRTRILTAEAKKKKEEASLKVFMAQLRDSEVVSPIDGVVSYRAFEEGEFVTAGSAVYTLYDRGDIWARVDVEESKIGRVRLGAPAEVTVPGMPGRSFPAKVFEIGELGEFATQKDVVRETHDIKTFRVKARILEPTGALKPGMTAEVRIFFGK